MRRCAGVRVCVCVIIHGSVSGWYDTVCVSTRQTPYDSDRPCGSVLIESFSHKCVRLRGGAGCCVTVRIKQKQNWRRRFDSVCSDFARPQKILLPFHQTAEQLLSIRPLQSTITNRPTDRLSDRPTDLYSVFFWIAPVHNRSHLLTLFTWSRSRPFPPHHQQELRDSGVKKKSAF